MTESDLSTVRDDIRDINITLKEMNGKLERLAIVEERYLQQSEGLGRAFTAIEKVDAKLDNYIRDNDKRVGGAIKWIWSVSGGATALTVIWMVLGAYIADSVKDLIKNVATNTATIQRLEQK